MEMKETENEKGSQLKEVGFRGFRFVPRRKFEPKWSRPNPK